MQNFYINRCRYRYRYRKSAIFLRLPLALALVGSCANASAQGVTYNPSWYIAPGVLGIDPEPDFGVDRRGAGAGLRFGKAISESWDIQFGTAYARVKRNNDRYQQNLLGIDVLYYFSRDTVRPFLLLGAGAQRDKVNKRDALNNFVSETSDTTRYVDAGIGMQFALSEQWLLQADLRRVHGFLDRKVFNIKRSDTNYLSIGLNFFFDKPVSRSRAAAPLVPAVAQVAPAPIPAPRFEKVKLSATELFEFDSAELNGPKYKLDEIAVAVNQDVALERITIIGHADRIGTEPYNMSLSERRAVAIKDYFLGRGCWPAGSWLKAGGRAIRWCTATTKNVPT